MFSIILLNEKFFFTKNYDNNKNAFINKKKNSFKYFIFQKTMAVQKLKIIK